MSTIHGVTVLRPKASAIKSATGAPGWPAWPACEEVFDVLQRWGLKTLGEFAALPAADLSARLGKAGVALQRLARGIDPRPLVPDPDVPRYIERMELEWPIDSLEPLSFVLARLLDPLSLALERADRGAAAIRLDLRLVDRSTASRGCCSCRSRCAIRGCCARCCCSISNRIRRGAAIDVVTIEVDPAPGRVLQYSLLERALPSAETLATLTARLARAGRRIAVRIAGAARLASARCVRDRAVRAEPRPKSAPGRAHAWSREVTLHRGSRVPLCLRRFRPPVAIRVVVERGRPVHVAIDRRGMPGGADRRRRPARGDRQASGGPAQHGTGIATSGTCRSATARSADLFQDGRAGWFIEGVFD